MNTKKIKQLIEERDRIDPQNDILAEENQKKVFDILKVNLNDTIEYLDNCTSRELFWVSELFDDLSEYFKSKELIECMERNSKRTGIDCKLDIYYAKEALNRL